MYIVQTAVLEKDGTWSKRESMRRSRPDAAALALNLSRTVAKRGYPRNVPFAVAELCVSSRSDGKTHIHDLIEIAPDGYIIGW